MKLKELSHLATKPMKKIIFEHLKEAITIIYGEKSNHGNKYHFLEDARKQLEKLGLNFSSCYPFSS